ncbi:MAG: A/G-specific adenine glycosylase [Rhodoferax sp.]|nr:A/G-specific adenine glycosylase [Rhodoferax sp.]
MSSPGPRFASRVVAWQLAHGRHHLPWQNTRDPYRVWLSEVMLQQTQVATVIGYFERFMARFPDVHALAQASQDEVMGQWSGLGYYSRARNLHRCAIEVVRRWGGVFPGDAQTLASLPGIGRSTAAAIASLCFGERVAILDANVRRVLARVLGFDADLASQSNQQLLWDAATDLLPRRDLSHAMPRYTQGMMDLGATVCLPRNPLCDRCPVRSGCVAYAQGRPQAFPVRSRTLRRSAQSVWLLWARSAGRDAVWLQRRPSPGVWAGLHCLPWFDSRPELEEQVPPDYRSGMRDHPVFTHVLTHKDLHLHPVQVELPRRAFASAADGGSWFDASAWPQLGLPAPVRRILLQA